MKYHEIDTITWISETDKFALGHLQKDTECEVVVALLEKLYSEDIILSANPCYYFKETTASGRPIDDRYDILRLTNEFTVKLKDGIPDAKLDSLIILTNTSFITKTEIYTIISTDKFSMFNSLEASRYFYETDYFKSSSPNISQTLRILTNN